MRHTRHELLETVRYTFMKHPLLVLSPCCLAVANGKGFTYDSTSDMFTVIVTPTVSEQKVHLDHLQKLTEYVFHLEH